MQERVSKLEGHYEALSGRMTTLEGKTDQIIRMLSENKARELPPIQTILTTIALAIALFGSAVTGMYYIIDGRVGSAVAKSDKFTEVMTANGGIFVKLNEYDHAISDLKAKVDALGTWRSSKLSFETTPTARQASP